MTAEKIVDGPAYRELVLDRIRCGALHSIPFGSNLHPIGLKYEEEAEP